MSILDYHPCAVCFRPIPKDRLAYPIGRYGLYPSSVCSNKCFTAYLHQAQAEAQETFNAERFNG